MERNCNRPLVSATERSRKAERTFRLTRERGSAPSSFSAAKPPCPCARVARAADANELDEALSSTSKYPLWRQRCRSNEWLVAIAERPNLLQDALLPYRKSVDSERCISFNPRTRALGQLMQHQQGTTSLRISIVPVATTASAEHNNVYQCDGRAVFQFLRGSQRL
jgi:hypothetical protein